MTPTGEPDPRRDVGPYPGMAAARAQYAASAHGIPVADTAGLAAVSAMVLAEALLLASVTVSEFETAERDALGRQLDPHTVQVIAGWILRAHLAGTGIGTTAGRGGG